MKLIEGIAEIDDLQAFLGELDDIAAAHGCTVQAFDARYVAGAEHLRRAVELADRAIVRDEAVARERGVEILLYAAGRRQIDRALTMGVEEGRRPVVVVVDEPPASVREALENPPGDGGDASAGARTESSAETQAESAAAAAVGDLLEPVDTLGEYDPERVHAFFDIGDAERDVVDGDVADLVLERVALLEVEK